MPSIVPEDTSLSVDDDSEVTDTDSDIDSEIPLLVNLSTPVAVISSPLGYLSTPAIGHTVKRHIEQVKLFDVYQQSYQF